MDSSRPNESREAGILRGLASSIAALVWLAACATSSGVGRAPPRAPAQRAVGTAPNRAAVVYVVRRSWHVDVGFTTDEMGQALAPLREALPDASYILVGFGDRAYLLGHGNRLAEMIGALFPSSGVLWVTGLVAAPQTVFGAQDVVAIGVTPDEERAVEHFVADSLTRSATGVAKPLAPGPYDASFYFASPERYSAVHTCNTWAAQALHTAGLPVQSAGVAFSFQLWRQVTPLRAVRSQ